MDYIAYYRQD